MLAAVAGELVSRHIFFLPNCVSPAKRYSVEKEAKALLGELLRCRRRRKDEAAALEPLVTRFRMQPVPSL